MDVVRNLSRRGRTSSIREFSSSLIVQPQRRLFSGERQRGATHASSWAISGYLPSKMEFRWGEVPRAATGVLDSARRSLAPPFYSRASSSS